MLHTDLIAPIPELLRRHAAARGSKTAYRDAQSSVTYAELLDRTGRLAGHLADQRYSGERRRRDHAAEFGAVGRSLLCNQRAGAMGVPISYDATESRDRLSSDRRELPAPCSPLASAATCSRSSKARRPT